MWMVFTFLVSNNRVILREMRLVHDIIASEDKMLV